MPPDESRYESTWVNFPNQLSDPEKGHALYQRYTRELLLAEDLGFDAIALNEHHQTAYSMMPAVGIRAAYMAALTKRVKLRISPEVFFTFDPSLDEGDKIERLLKEVRSKEGW